MQLQTSGSKSTDNENAKQSLLEFNPHHLCAKFVGMIFHF